MVRSWVRPRHVSKDAIRSACSVVQVEPPPEGKGGMRGAREASKAGSDASKAAAGKASANGRAGRGAAAAAAAEKPVTAPASRAGAKPRKAQQQETGSATASGRAAKQQPAASRAAKLVGKGASLKNSESASAARQDAGSLSRAGSAGKQSRRGAEDAGRAQTEAKLGAPVTPAINRKRKGGGAAGASNEQVAERLQPAKRQRSGSLPAKAGASAAAKGRRKSPRGEGALCSRFACMHQ